LIQEEISSIQQETAHKLVVLDEKKREKEAILVDKERQQEVYKSFKSRESELLTELEADQKRKDILKTKINAAIRKEIAEAEAKAKMAAEAKKKREAAEARRKAAELALLETEKSADEVKNTDVASVSEVPKESAEVAAKREDLFAETKEAAELGKNFESNKGKLPWPVEKGTITDGFGKNAHPTLENVFTNNSGIDISTPKSAQVRAVFEGEVTSVLNIPGAGKVVIIKHGNYRTVYTNLQDTYVSAGSKVKTKQSIGALIAGSNSTVSVAHFEIHQVIGSSVQCINPSLWITR
jgi:murein hydrolase activator